MCGCIHTTLPGYQALDFAGGHNIRAANSGIAYMDADWFRKMEAEHPGTLLNNCSYDFWEKRYATGHYDGQSSDAQRSVLRSRAPSRNTENLGDERASSEWCLRLNLQQHGVPDSTVTLFGITEDVTCPDGTTHHVHSEHMRGGIHRRELCDRCQVPVCATCRSGIASYKASADTGSVPMALANDNYYGYAMKLLAEKRITWLECAAASLVWTTLMVYYIEQPYGHLMHESMEGAQGRTHARGNLFSFSMPWEDIESRCKEADRNWGSAAEAAVHAARTSMTLPHSEEVLACLVNVHIVGGPRTSWSVLTAPPCAWVSSAS